MSDPFGFGKNNDLGKHAKIDGYSLFQDMGNEWHGDTDKWFSLKRLIANERVIFLFAIFGLGILLLFGKLFWLQIFQGNYYRSVAEGNRIRTQEIKADRGLIYDRNGEQLVENLPDFYLSVVAAELPQDEEFLTMIKKIKLVFSDETVGKILDIYKQRSAYYQAKVVEEHIDLDKVILFEINCPDCPGIYVKNQNKRGYLTDDLLSHSMGYLGLINQEELDEDGEDYSFDDYLGKNGLELSYEDYLRGQKGYKKIEVDSRGKESQIISSQPAEIGQSLKLTIDLGLQKEMYRAIEKELSKLKTKRAVGIAMNPQNGEILSLVSYPGYDNNLFVQGISSEDYAKLMNDPDNPMFFRAIAGEYPPGSTIKPLMALAALQEGIVTENTQVNSTGGLRINEWVFPDWKAGGHGLTNVKKAIANSVNTYFYYIGGGYDKFEGLGVERIKKYLESFGLGQPTGIDLYGERGGFVPSKDWKESTKNEAWYIGDTYHLSIGQGDLLVTPLQVATYTSMIANGGKIYQPRLVDKIIDPETGIENELPDKLVKTVEIDPQNIKIVQEGMRDTVVYGSGVSLSSLPFTSAGKTGTAQAGGDKENHGWFTGYAPYENPEIEITILIENGGGGDVVAVPIAKEVLRWYFENKD
ncbi:MAG: penicillin-binding protein 2 [Patescibacteria group bacterium]